MTFSRAILLIAFAGVAIAHPAPVQALEPILRAGQGVTDITPPAGTELAGFHKAPGALDLLRKLE